MFKENTLSGKNTEHIPCYWVNCSQNCTENSWKIRFVHCKLRLIYLAILNLYHKKIYKEILDTVIFILFFLALLGLL